MRLAHTLLFLGLAVGLAACDRDGSERTEPVGPAATADTDADPDTSAPVDAPAAAGGTMLAASAIATLQPAPGGTASGTLRFDVGDGGVRMTGGLTGLPPDATLAMHLHEVGDCSSPDFSSAGDHFNPDAQPHGDRAGSGPHHAGDMPNQVADAAGNAKVDQLLDGLGIDGGGANDVVGKSVIVHEKADDYTTQPSGAAGARIACGVIELENPAPEYLGPADAAPAAAPADPDDGVEGTQGTGAAADVDNPTDVEGPAAAEDDDDDGY